MRFRSLRARLVLLVLIPSIPLLALTAYVAGELRDRDIANARAELTAFAGLAASDLQEVSEYSRHLLEAISRIPVVARGDPEECARVFAAMVQSAPRIGSLFRTDGEGAALCHSAGALGRYGDREYFRAVRGTGQFFTGEAVIGRVTRKPLFVTSLPVRGDDGEFLGALVSGIDLRWFGDNLVRRMPFPGLSFAMWAPDGTILYRHPDPELWVGRKVSDTGIAQAVGARATGADLVEATDVQGAPTLYAIRGTEDWAGTRITMSVGAPRAALVEEADAIFRRSLLGFAAIFALALGTALLVGEFGSRRRAAALTRASARLGAGDLAARTGLAPSGDELGQLAGSFDRMAERLQSASVNLRLLSEAGKALVHARDEDSLLRDIARIVVEHGDYLECSAGPAGGEAQGALRDACEAAERRGEPVVDRERRIAALPVHAGDHIVGALGVRARAAGGFGDEALARLMELADDLGFGILALRNRQALDRHAQDLEALVAERTSQLEAANRHMDTVITEQREHQREVLALNAALAKRAAELDAANRELEAFSYSVSHDLRAPLRHVQGYVELLSNAAGAALSDKARRYLTVIGDSAREMGMLIDDLLAFSRTARTEMRRVPVEAGTLVADAIKGLEMQAEGRNVEWRIGALPRVMGDPVLLRQVFANLLGNALKYTRGRDPAVIEVGATQDPNGVAVIHVRDNGVGFDMKHAAKLFGVFQRLHRADEFEGTGIGLAIAQRVVSRHGGRIWAEAQPGRGATFFFTLVPASAGDGTILTEAA